MIRSYLLSFCVCLALGTFAQGTTDFDVLVFSKTNGYRHTSIEAGVESIQALGKAHNFSVDHTEDSTRFSDSGLAKYEAIIFLSTTGNVLGNAEEAAFERFIRSGKGYVGIHAAADTEYDWEFYRKVVGRQFVQHPEHQTGTIYTIDQDFPGMEGFGDSLSLYEEWYEYTVAYDTDLKYLMRLDTTSISMAGWKGQSKMGVFHPLAWYHKPAGGRAFYTGIGHMDETFVLPAFQQHLSAAIRWAATGLKE